MNHRTKWLIGSVLILTVLNCENSLASSENEENLRAVSSGMNQFSADFYKTSSESTKDNLICSPLSAGIVLSMAAYGARGNTEKQMQTSLRMPENDAVGKSGFQSLIDTLNSVKKVQLKLAQKIFTTTGFEMKPDFKDITENNFRSTAQSLDFSKAVESSQTINKWCEEQTNSRIKEIVQPDDLNGAAMVLLNAVYFKGNWLSKFKGEQTLRKPFHVDEKSTKDVDMMHQRHSFNYGELPELDAIFVELPYEKEDENDAISMFIILPNDVNGLSKSEKSLSTVNFKSIHDNQRMTDMHLYMPKFKIESTLQLQPILEKMGMTDMFSDIADFTGITDSSPLKVSKVIQKAFIEVNEEGSEAAAVTAGVISFRSSKIPHPTPITVMIDRPFIYTIVHSAANAVLFQGHISDPVF
ncbi:leukocyte elastase inhibitor-like isoform X3 [Cotesia glomerata]|uniref:leukocyte elastase inhibitor-like isoform X3 n=1 Tax=Cotesia glomerata TaxID=32391 RepID=UPI001D0211B0|nr:leukocyte elastase inhibitor-like isoform X3 [Cotesia glomerata]